MIERDVVYSVDKLNFNQSIDSFFQSSPSFSEDAFEFGVSPSSVGGTISPVFKSIQVGTRTVAIKSGNELQAAINQLQERGGGILRLAAAVYVVDAANLNVPSSVKIIGETRDTTIIHFNSTNKQIVVAGTDVYLDGTISSITNGGITVNGSSTAWNTNNNVTTSHQILIDERWYKISVVVNDTTLILAEPYKDASTFSGTYRASIVASDILFESLTIQSSTNTAIDFDDIRDVLLRDILFISNNKAFTINNLSFVDILAVTIANSTSNGYEVTNGQFFNARSFATLGNGGHGGVWNNMKTCGVTLCAANGNSGDGYNLTDVVSCDFKLAIVGNTGQGMEMVSGCNKNMLDVQAVANTSDGVKLTASSDQNRIMGILTNNGGKDWNIANANCNNNEIRTSLTTNGTSADYTDNGTDTVIIVATDPTQFKFGGDGADGALSITSGTTTIDLSGAAVVEKNYTSISITGTGKLAFSNPHANGTIIILKSQGDVTITSSTTPAIDVSALGSVATTKGSGFFFLVPNGTDGGDGNTSVGVGGEAPLVVFSTNGKALPIATSSGGGAGGDSTGVSPRTGGAGGRGGGALYMEVGGALNITSTLWAKGGDGSNGQDSSGNNTNCAGGGGGGGAGGIIVIFYTTLTDDSGTYVVTGGVAGSVGNESGCSGHSSGRGAGSGASITNSGSDGVVSDGADGADGESLIVKNTEFA